MPLSDLLARLEHFRHTDLERYRELYRRLATDGQRPAVLFVSCADSRIVPNLLTAAGPGELFVVRTVANIVCAPDEQAADPTLAAVEFAVAELGVTEIVVCGHSRCGGMAALYEPPPAELVHLRGWLEHARPAALPPERLAELDADERDRLTAQRNVLLALDRLAAHPLVGTRRADRSLILHGWYLDLATQEVEVYDPEAKTFRPIDEVSDRAAAAPAAGSDASPAAPPGGTAPDV